MPNIKSAKKRVKVIETKTLQNQMIKSNLKTTLKNFDSVCESGDKDAIEVSFNETVKRIDQAASKNIIKTNNASRKKSAVAKKRNAAISK